jgi:hypothetical protein
MLGGTQMPPGEEGQEKPDDKPNPTPQGEGSGGAVQPPASKPTGSDQPAKPAGDGGCQPSKPADKGDDGDKPSQSQQKPTAQQLARKNGLHPQKFNAIKKALAEEMRGQILSELQEEVEKEEGDYEKAYNRVNKKLLQIEPEHQALQARVEHYEDILAKQLETRIKDWPDEAKKSDPAKLDPDNFTLQDRLRWADTVEPLLSLAPKAPPSKGNPAGPKPGAQNPSKEQMDAYIERKNNEYALQL